MAYPESNAHFVKAAQSGPRKEEKPLPDFGAMLVALSRVFDVTGFGGSEVWIAAAAAEAMATRLCPAQRAEVTAATLLRNAGALGLEDHRGARQALRACAVPDCPRCRNLPEALLNHPERSAEWIRHLPGLSEAATLVAFHEETASGSGYPRGARWSDCPLPARVVQFVDVATTGAWALRVAGAFSRDALLKFLAVSEGVETAPGLFEAFADALDDPMLIDALAAGTVARAFTDRLVACVDALGVPFADSVGRLCEAFGAIVDAATSERRGHSASVAAGCLKLASEAGLPARERTTLKWSALVHDLGELLSNSSSQASTGTHAELSARLLDLPSLAPMAAIVRAHHEHWDGSGEPDHLAGKAIPYAARILSVVDAFHEKLTFIGSNTRESRAFAWGWVEARREKLFDPDIVAMGRSWVEATA
jgi:HD-GYP domain-containing protein (c-di-GMP phosphodiesterase class II)